MDLDVSPAGWLATVGLIAVLLAIDLTLAGSGRAGWVRGAAVWSGFYVAVAMTFGVVFVVLVGWGFGAQYFAGYIVEKSLSIDRVLTITAVASIIATPQPARPRTRRFLTGPRARSHRRVEPCLPAPCRCAPRSRAVTSSSARPTDPPGRRPTDATAADGEQARYNSRDIVRTAAGRARGSAGAGPG